MKDKWYTVDQAAERLGIHPATIRRWCAGGLFPGARYRYGHKQLGWQIPESAILILEQGGRADAVGAQ